METLVSLGILFIAVVAACFLGVGGFIVVIVFGTIYQYSARKEKRYMEMQNKILEELKEIKYRNSK